MEEIWKDIAGFEKRYKISSIGRVKSLERVVRYFSGTRIVKEQILCPCLDEDGYLHLNLCKNNRHKPYFVHLLVWDHFGDTPRTKNDRIDHDDNIKIHCWINNLKRVTNRQNVSKGWLQHPKTSKHIGVYWNRNEKKWRSCIRINGKQKHLGYFRDEELAAQSYQNALSQHIVAGGI
jgi:hypothetical protein